MTNLAPEQAEQIRSARLAAAIKKVKAGKSLTLDEQRLIDSMTEPERADRATWPEQCASMAQASAVMGVARAVLKRAKAQGAPGFHASNRVNPRQVAAWLDGQGAMSTTSKPTGASPARRTLAEEIDDVSGMLAQVDALMRDAFARGDVSTGLALASETKGLWDRRKAAQVELRRQGRTEDDVLSRPEVERMAHALAHHACIALQRLAAEVAPRLVGLTSPVEAVAILEAAFVPAAYLGPFRASVSSESGSSLPAWVVDAMERAATSLTE